MNFLGQTIDAKCFQYPNRRFKIIRSLGKGGEGEVFLSESLNWIENQVPQLALKIQSKQEDLSFLQSFKTYQQQNEGQAFAFPSGMIKIYDVFEWNQSQVIAMEAGSMDFASVIIIIQYIAKTEQEQLLLLKNHLNNPNHLYEKIEKLVKNQFLINLIKEMIYPEPSKRTVIDEDQRQLNVLFFSHLNQKKEFQNQNIKFNNNFQQFKIQQNQMQVIQKLFEEQTSQQATMKEIACQFNQLKEIQINQNNELGLKLQFLFQQLEEKIEKKLEEKLLYVQVLEESQNQSQEQQNKLYEQIELKVSQNPKQNLSNQQKHFKNELIENQKNLLQDFNNQLEIYIQKNSDGLLLKQTEANQPQLELIQQLSKEQKLCNKAISQLTSEVKRDQLKTSEFSMLADLLLDKNKHRDQRSNEIKSNSTQTMTDVGDNLQYLIQQSEKPQQLLQYNSRQQQEEYYKVTQDKNYKNLKQGFKFIRNSEITDEHFKKQEEILQNRFQQIDKVFQEIQVNLLQISEIKPLIKTIDLTCSDIQKKLSLLLYVKQKKEQILIQLEQKHQQGSEKYINSNQNPKQLKYQKIDKQNISHETSEKKQFQLTSIDDLGNVQTNEYQLN